VRFLSLADSNNFFTAFGKAAYNCKSTLAVTFLTEILENTMAKKDKNGNIISEIPKQNIKNQSRFSKIFIMEYTKKDFGKIKLTVGELRCSKQKVQYCITAIENG
jgi:hypothetical protein